MLLIDDSSKTIFLHNPKCGGTFVKNKYLECHKDFPQRMFFGLHNADSNTDEAHINAFQIARFMPGYKEYRMMAFVRNPYNRFMAAFKTGSYFDTKTRTMWSKYGKDLKKVCEYLLSCDCEAQDNFLRNTKRPWFMPQYLFMRPGVEVLKYESLDDWRRLFDTLGIEGGSVVIKPDYDIDDETKAMVRQLYFDDEELFAMYD